MRPVAVVVGGAGSLGKNIVRCFMKNQYKVLSVDYKDNLDADHSFLLSPEASLPSNGKHGINGNPSIPHWLLEGNRMEQELCKLKNQHGFRAVISVAGGWVGGHPQESSFLQSVEQMWKMNGQSAALACSIAAKTLERKNGLFVLTGARGALGPTPSMLGYGMAKVATHQIVHSMAAEQDFFTTLGLLPGVIDTPMNRQGMPDANFDDWTPCMEIAEKVERWSSEPETRPESGSLVEIHTEGGKTNWIVTNNN